MNGILPFFVIIRVNSYWSRIAKTACHFDPFDTAQGRLKGEIFTFAETGFLTLRDSE